MDPAIDVPFRVIIVGAGVTGLVLANILQRARIDFVILEAHPEVVRPEGSSFGIWPNAARILDQIGCWEGAKSISRPIEHSRTVDYHGKTFTSSDIMARVSAHLGYDCLVLERQAYLRILYENIIEKTKVLTGRRVIDVCETPDGVRVHLEGGRWEHGDIVVGCDGVHSIVRTMMWKHAKVTVPGLISTPEKMALHSDFHCLVGVAPHIMGIGESVSISVQRKGFCIQVISQPKQLFFFVCFKSPKSIIWPERRSFTDEDTEQEAAKIADVLIETSVPFGEIWRQRIRGYLCSLEEGVFDHWHAGRTVLVGDSAHKMSPLLAHGGNCGLESAAALANGLYRELNLHHNCKPDKKTLEAVFNTYQTSRLPRTKKLFTVVHRMTRLYTSDSLPKRLITRFIVPFILDDAKAATAMMRGAVKLDFLPIPPHPPATVGFDDEIVQQEEKCITPTGSFQQCAKSILGTMVKSWALIVLAVFIQSVVVRLSQPVENGHSPTLAIASQN